MKSSLSNISTRIEISVAVQSVPDLQDPITRRTVIPEMVIIYLSRSEDREWAQVSVHGPRRLKSGSRGLAIDSMGWEKAAIEPLHRAAVERPQWLSHLLTEFRPSGWPATLLDLPGGAS